MTSDVLLVDLARIALGQQPSDEDAFIAPAATQKARENGLRVEEWARDTAAYLPVNEATKMAMIIEDDDVAAAVIEKMRACGAKMIPEARASRQVEPDTG
jgi:hypothetical protein